MHLMGIMGGLRRYAQSTEFKFLEPLQSYQEFVSIAAFITAAAQVIFLVNLFWSIFKGKKASENPWESTTLEWTIPSPPPHDNFAGKIPIVHHDPYEYGVPGSPRDFVMQTDPPIEKNK